METTIIAISNQKGGVGKSTTAYNLGACLALNHGKRVLLVDFDPQANLSEYLKYEPNGNPTMTQLIMSFHAGTPLNAEATQNAIRHSDTAGVDYIPSDINLANAETLMVTMISKEHILRRILTEDVIEGYDFVLIDCLPSLGTLLINALTAADRVLIPVQTQKFSMDGLQSLEALTQLVKANTNPKLDLIGVLPTMVDRTKVSRTAIDTLNEKYGEMLFRTSISKSIEAAKSSENGIPLCLTGHKLGQEYDELAQEVRMSELAMNPNRKVTTVCNGKKQEWDDREEAQAYFLEAMMNSDGAEHDRYSCIFIQLQNGLSCCTDEDDEEDE